MRHRRVKCVVVVAFPGNRWPAIFPAYSTRTRSADPRRSRAVGWPRSVSLLFGLRFTYVTETTAIDDRIARYVFRSQLPRTVYGRKIIVLSAGIFVARANAPKPPSYHVRPRRKRLRRTYTRPFRDGNAPVVLSVFYVFVLPPYYLPDNGSFFFL